MNSYPKIYNLGHRELEGFLKDNVLVEEKIDGSQFSFGVYSGILKVRSKGQEMDPYAPEKMFTTACQSVLERQGSLVQGWTYRCEYLQKPKHNTLAYDRVPQGNLIIFDIDKGDQHYCSPKEKIEEAANIGLEAVPAFFYGKINSFDEILKFMETISHLGGQKIEGMVIKNYYRYGADKKVLMAKYVSEAFKEIHRKDWKERHPGGKDIKESITESLRTPARWAKAVQHLKEKGQLTSTPRDIGSLIKEIASDVQVECQDEIKQALFNWAWKDIQRGIVRGFPQWYKDELAKKQFEEEK